MERHLDTDLGQIREKLLLMAARVEQMISTANEALVDRDSTLVEQVIDQDGSVDELEMQIDEACLEIMALRQPTAGDLRFLVATMKITSDLERIGDSAVNIAKSVRVVNAEPPIKPYIDLPRMSAMCREMVELALDAFVKKDNLQARNLKPRDKKIDALYKQLFRELLMYMIEDPKLVTRGLHLLLIARNLERIADHATNIGESVVFYVEGKDIRHGKNRTLGESGATAESAAGSSDHSP